MLQRRSKPVKGSVLAFSLSVLVGALELDGSADLLVGVAGVPVSFDGEVPVLGVVGVVGVAGVVGVVGVVGVLGVFGVWL